MRVLPLLEVYLAPFVSGLEPLLNLNMFPFLPGSLWGWAVLLSPCLWASTQGNTEEMTLIVVLRVGVRGSGRGAWFPVFLLFGWPYFSTGTEAEQAPDRDVLLCWGRLLGTFENTPFALQRK